MARLTRGMEGVKPVSANSLNAGASRVRKALMRMEPDAREEFLTLLWPELDPRISKLIALHPEETRVNGARFSFPASWASSDEKEELKVVALARKLAVEQLREVYKTSPSEALLERIKMLEGADESG